ncbi:MAG: hypothetical protein AAF798_21515 [Bacteroidota bacterium]
MKELVLDRDAFLDWLKTAIEQDPQLLQDLVDKILKEEKVDERTKRVAAVIQNDFDRFDHVFKALA